MCFQKKHAVALNRLVMDAVSALTLVAELKVINEIVVRYFLNIHF